MNRYTIHVDVLAPDSAAAWDLADELGESFADGTWSLTTADDWARHVARDSPAATPVPPADQNPDPDSWLLHEVASRIYRRWDGTRDGDGLTLLALAVWLEAVRVQHRPDLQEVYLEDCEDCQPDDCDGHDRKCCWSCTANSDDGYAVPVLYPCQVMRYAAKIARVYLTAHAFKGQT